MKVTFTNHAGNVYKLKPDEGSTTIGTKETCPHCNTENVRVKGTGQSIDPNSPRDTYRADAVCDSCGEPVGVLRVKMDTLFGIEEDERVLNGRARVY